MEKKWAVYYENVYNPSSRTSERLFLGTFDTEKEAKKFRSQFLANIWANLAVVEQTPYSSLHNYKLNVTVEKLP